MYNANNTLKKVILLGVSFYYLIVCCTGCVKEVSTEKKEEIDYTVVKEADIPDYLMENIESKKNDAFRLSYSDSENLYIAAGYGEQMSGGYSIVVDDLFLSDNAIIFATTLKGPESERKGNKPTYPYIVVKMENMDKEIIYK